VEWLVISAVVAALGAVAVRASLRRLGAAADQLLDQVPALRGDELVDGGYGKVAGRARSVADPIAAPGPGTPCVWCEVVVRRATRDRSVDMLEWREIDRKVEALELALTVDGREVRVDPRDAVVVRAVEASVPGHVLEGWRDSAVTSTVRMVPIDADIEVAGTLTRQVDANPAAAADYRETAVIWRLIATRERPLVIGVRRR
jgi:hypothetical protein